MADGFPPQWRDPNVTSDELRALGPSPLANSLRGAPMLILVTYDPRVRAPASANDALGMMSLGCVMENIWLSAQVLGIGVHIVSNVAEDSVANAIKHMLAIPSPLNLAFAMAIGYPKHVPDYLRVRRDVTKILHRNRYRGE